MDDLIIPLVFNTIQSFICQSWPHWGHNIDTMITSMISEQTKVHQSQ